MTLLRTMLFWPSEPWTTASNLPACASSYVEPFRAGFPFVSNPALHGDKDLAMKFAMLHGRDAFTLMPSCTVPNLNPSLPVI